MLTIHRFHKTEPILIENEALSILSNCSFYIDVADSIALYAILCKANRLLPSKNQTQKTLMKELGWSLPKLRHNICVLQKLKIVKGELPK